MLIAEDYLLLTMKDDGTSWVTSRELGVAGALLGELAAQERVMLDEKGRLVVLDPGSTGDEVLDDFLGRLGDRAGKKPKDVLTAVSKGMARALLERLARAEIIREDRRNVLGVRLWSVWPFVDTSHRDQVRAGLLGVLLRRQEPDVRTGTLVSLLHATSAWGTALPKETRAGLKGSEIRSRAKEITKGRWGSEAVAKVITDMNAAVTAAVFVSGASGGN